jgi:hypothetical protein
LSLSFVAAVTDSNPAGASKFVGIPLPAGVQNGDCALVGITLPAASVTVTPPDSTWILLFQTDTTQALGLAVFYLPMVLSPPTSWIFALSSSINATGVLAIYRGADSFTPVDVTSAVLTSSSVTHNVAGLSASMLNEELVLFMGAGASGTYTPTSPFTFVARKQQTGATTELQRAPLQAAGAVAAFTETFSVGTTGAAVMIALVPNLGTLDYNAAYQRVFDGLPPGIDKLLDFSPTGDFYNFFWVIGSMLKVYGFDLLDLARTEIIPFLARYKLPDWEGIFGLRGTRTAQTGTIPARQNNVLGAWRAAAGQGSSIPAVQGVLGPILGYFGTTAPKVLEADVPTLRLMHSYGFNGDVLCGGGAVTTNINIIVDDGGIVSHMGAQLDLRFQSAPASVYGVKLAAPDGTSYTWTSSQVPSGQTGIYLYAPSLVGSQIGGTWVLSITNNDGPDNRLLDGLCLFVEGIKRGQQTGGAIFDWGVYADPAHIGENGSTADFSSARQAIYKMAQSHTIGNLIQSLAPYPDTNSGLNAAIPDECCPT